MKQKAILYTRVSTDEQNDGYSPADQKERLIKYCDQVGIEIIGFYHDDESGKTFKRPEWLNIISFIKKNKGAVDLLLFIKWDRFSRNVAEAYIAIRDLRKYGIEPQAIEQPLNFEIPESKIMLAVYLAAPEVDNDRRALNIFHGIRRGKKEGRWLGGCPRGYKNARNENNRPIILPSGGKQQELVIEAFSLFSTGLYPIEDLRRRMNKEGLKTSRQSFWLLLRNKIYVGKVFVPAYKDEQAVWVEGQHEGIIEESVFYNVQEVLAGRKRNVPLKNSKVRDELPLRGNLICPLCERTMTGSASTGRHGGKFFYYHCSNGCKERHKASEINHEFLNVLQSFKANPETLELYGNIVKQSLKENNHSVKEDLHNITKDVEKQKQRMQNARALMLDGEITTEDYRAMKHDIEIVLEELLVKQILLKGGNENYDKEIDFCVRLLKNIDNIYKQANTEGKQSIIGSLFPEKLIFENNQYRTPRLNSVVSLICNGNGHSKGCKKRKYAIVSVPSWGVISPRIELGSKV
jgi:site-specific DNA recombinase